MTGKTKYDLDRGNHVVYSLHYHIIFVIKYRRKALYNDRLTLGEMGKLSMTKMVIQLMKIDGKDPRPLLQRNGMLKVAEESGWLV